MTQKKRIFRQSLLPFPETAYNTPCLFPSPPPPSRFCLNALSSWGDCLIAETIETGIWKQWVAILLRRRRRGGGGGGGGGGEGVNKGCDE